MAARSLARAGQAPRSKRAQKALLPQALAHRSYAHRAADQGRQPVKLVRQRTHHYRHQGRRHEPVPSHLMVLHLLAVRHPLLRLRLQPEQVFYLPRKFANTSRYYRSRHPEGQHHEGVHTLREGMTTITITKRSIVYQLMNDEY